LVRVKANMPNRSMRAEPGSGVVVVMAVVVIEVPTGRSVIVPVRTPSMSTPNSPPTKAKSSGSVNPGKPQRMSSASPSPTHSKMAGATPGPPEKVMSVPPTTVLAPQVVNIPDAAVSVLLQLKIKVLLPTMVVGIKMVTVWMVVGVWFWNTSTTQVSPGVRQPVVPAIAVTVGFGLVSVIGVEPPPERIPTSGSMPSANTTEAEKLRRATIKSERKIFTGTPPSPSRHKTIEGNAAIEVPYP